MVPLSSPPVSQRLLGTGSGPCCEVGSFLGGVSGFPERKFHAQRISGQGALDVELAVGAPRGDVEGGRGGVGVGTCDGPRGLGEGQA